LLTLPPVFLIRLRPHDALTHHIVAAAQVGFSTLLIHLTGGRIETHFHVFGSLAFLALYRDWRLLLTATVIVALDHLLRGIWFPSSVYGVPYATAWRTVEHAAWVLFEDAVLVWACVASRREMREICQQQDARTALLENLEERVQSRTAELAEEAAQHKETATELRASEERFRNLVTHAPIGIFKTLRNGEILVANPHLLSMLALPADVALKNLSMRSGQLFDAEARERMWQHLLHGGELRAYEAQLRRTDGSLVDVLINGRLIDFDVPGGPACEGTVEDVTERKQAERELDRVHRQLVTASRQAGMAEVATGVLHNVGNVLTSVNLTLHDVQERLRKSPLAHLTRVAGVLQRERPRLPEFLTVDPAGRQLPDFVSKLATHLETENQTLQADISSLTGHFEHIRDIVVTQQSAARMIGLIEALDPVQLLDDALALHAKSHDRHRITIECDHAPTGLVLADRHKVLQILVNLLQNAKEALLTVSQETRRITLRVAAAGPETVAIVVADNGPGIAPEHRARLFQHGFTTKKNGHGFGLHSCVLAAREMKGDLTVESAGPGCGATFTLSLPLARVSPVAVATPVAETALV
ncbi:MAG TPA: ATP-binding protein, partial [Candidatus Synoicihabitans sp.]|nr:ATP-binding protein [Candidatus Synoicihabitans sp.]